MSEVIRTENLTKKYKDVVAVSEVSINVRQGEIYGFLGLNGAGKTTTIRLLLGMLSPDDGASFIFGRKVTPNDTGLWKDVGYLVEVPHAYPDLTVRENLEIIRRLRLIKNKNAVFEIMDKLKLAKYENRKAGNLSLGNAQRLGLAKALIHHPRILILDEPANGLDPAGIFEIRELLTSLAKGQGVTIFISSHILGEISRFATRIGIIHDGRLIQEINTPQLEELCRKRLLVKTRNNEAAKSILRRNGIEALENHDNILEIFQENYVEHPENIASLLANSQVPPTLLTVKEEELESYFLRTIELIEKVQ